MTIDTIKYTRIGIYKNDLLVIDRAIKPKEGDYVIFEAEGEFHLGNTSYLKPDVIICGVIIYIIHKVQNK